MLIARFLQFRTILLACAALVTGPCGVDAQTPVQPGARVRILAPSTADTLMTGTVAAIDSAWLLLSPRFDAPEVRVPLSAIRQLEVGTRRRGDGRTLGIVGAVIGAAIVWSAIDSGPCEGCGLVPVRPLGALAGAGAGYLAGFVIGGAAAPEEWNRVPVPGRRQP